MVYLLMSECGEGTFGMNCQHKCKCLNRTVCDRITGKCGLCASGWQGDNCLQGDYSDNYELEVVWAILQESSLILSWLIFLLSECHKGTFGVNCQEDCHCQNQTKCNKKTGQCGDGQCAPGWQGENCQQRK